MMLHRKDFENHNFSFKVHCNPIYSVCYACSGPEGIIHYSKSTEPPKIQEIAKMPTHMVWPCVTRYLTFTHGLTAANLASHSYQKAFRSSTWYALCVP